MGLFMDILEDIAERTPVPEPSAFSSPTPSTPHEPAAEEYPNYQPRIQCQFCGQHFTTNETLNRHRFERHGASYFYIRVNDTPAKSVEHLLHSLQSLQIISRGNDDIDITISVASKQTRLRLKPNQSLDLLRELELDRNYHGEICITGVLGAYKRSYHLSCNFPTEQAEPALQEYDDIILKAQQPLLAGKYPNIECLSEALQHVSDRGVESYLKGFVEYFLGYRHEMMGDWPAAKSCFETALALLGERASPLAQTATAILAFKMGAYRRLRGRPRSRFSAAVKFLASPRQDAQPVPLSSGCQRGVWMDEFQELVLRVVNHYYARDWLAADRELRSAPRELVEEPNNHLKLLIMTARVAEALGDHRRSQAAWRELLGYPDYTEEARSRIT